MQRVIDFVNFILYYLKSVYNPYFILFLCALAGNPGKCTEWQVSTGSSLLDRLIHARRVTRRYMFTFDCFKYV